MILEKASINDRRYFLIEFTKKLIRASSKEDFIELKIAVQKDAEERQEKIEKPLTNKQFTERIKEKLDPFPRLNKIELGKPLPPKRVPKRIPLRVVRIPEYSLPPTFQDVRPTYRPIELNLGELTPLLKDPMVREIQCDGPNKNVLVKGAMGLKKTAIVLEQHEIENILDTFAREARIPIQGGITKIVLGNLVLSAITSDVIESKFIIKKMLPEPIGGRRFYGR